MSNLPPVQPSDLRRNRRTQPEDDDLGENYPPSNTNYPPQSNNYPPANQGYPPAPDPRFTQPPAAPLQQQTQWQQAPNSYPPPDQSYPPAGNISLDDPRFGAPRQPVNQGYPPPANDYGDYGDYENVDLDDPAFGAPSPRNFQAPYEQPSSLDRVNAPDLRRERYAAQDDDDISLRSTPPRGTGRGTFLTERQVESLAWGSVVILLGISLMLAVTGNSQFVRIIFPLAAGFILLISSIYQRVVMGWHVGRLTWLTAVLLLSYTITLTIADDNAGFFRWIVYFTGTLVIMVGIVVLLQVFQEQRPRR